MWQDAENEMSLISKYFSLQDDAAGIADEWFSVRARIDWLAELEPDEGWAAEARKYALEIDDELQIGLEAVILTNGERPSLFVRDGFVDLNAPDIGDWGLGLNRFQNVIRKVISSVGRIDVPVRPWFAGTCFVVAEGLVVTNRHVLEEIATRDAAGAWTLNWPDATTVDFVGEDGAAAGTKFKVTGVAFAGTDPINRSINFAHLDMAILHVDPASNAANPFPMPVTFETDTVQPKARRDLYVVGFPGEPRIWAFDGKPPTGHESTQVISTLFNNRFGVKRLAPGTVRIGAGEVARDEQNWICAHDASTLGGNSGSCVADLSGDGFRVVALHFAGANREQNWAHVAARLRGHLSNFSATFAPEEGFVAAKRMMRNGA